MNDQPALRREVGVAGATLMGLGSMIGAGVFVGVGLAVGVAGPATIPATLLAAALALCNALSSAQLAAAHPVSGGTYEYGHRYLNPAFGVTAGWMFLCAKTASAATAALGAAGYLLHLVGQGRLGAAWLAAGAVAALTALVLAGVRRSNWLNAVLVGATLAALSALVVAGAPNVLGEGRANLSGVWAPRGGVPAFLEATALMFVAFTGYARIATMGEEIREPRRSIPRAIVVVLAVTTVLYVAVELVAIAAVGSPRLAEAAKGAATPLEAAARGLGAAGLPTIVAAGAVTAMLGVLLNLILGLSRVVLAMGRRGDLPPLFGRVSTGGEAPTPAVIAVGLVIAAVALAGGVEVTWSFSAFTVLVYYAVTNLAALKLPKSDRLYSPVFAVGGLVGCLFLAFWVPPPIWLAGLAVIAAGLAVRAAAPHLWKVRRGE